MVMITLLICTNMSMTRFRSRKNAKNGRSFHSEPFKR
ncbi:unnamed protein product [Brassica oleracea]